MLGNGPIIACSQKRNGTQINLLQGILKKSAQHFIYQLFWNIKNIKFLPSQALGGAAPPSRPPPHTGAREEPSSPGDPDSSSSPFWKTIFEFFFFLGLKLHYFSVPGLQKTNGARKKGSSVDAAASSKKGRKGTLPARSMSSKGSFFFSLSSPMCPVGAPGENWPESQAPA